MRHLPLFVAAIGLVLSGCATVVSGPLQKVAVTSRPAGAEVIVDDAAKGTTPTTIEVSRWADHEVVLERRGFRPYHLHLSRIMNPWVAMNISNGFIVGVAVDASTGAIYRLDPPVVQADLFPSGVRRRLPMESSPSHSTGAVSPRTGAMQLVIASTLQPQPGLRKIGQMEPQGRGSL